MNALTESSETVNVHQLTYAEWLKQAGWQGRTCPWNLREEWSRDEDPSAYTPYSMDRRSDTSGT